MGCVDVGSDLRKIVVHMIELVDKANKSKELKEILSVMATCQDTTIAQAASVIIAKWTTYCLVCHISFAGNCFLDLCHLRK